MGRARVGDASGSEGAAARALALAPEDARIRFLAGELALRRAGAVQGLARQGLIERGRRHFRASLSIDRVNPDARLGMARSYAFDGENAARGLEWIGTLRTLRTGSLEVDLVAARLHARAGAPDRASRLVARVASRTHSPRLAERALGIRDASSR
jgi:hypothetical protein